MGKPRGGSTPLSRIERHWCAASLRPAARACARRRRGRRWRRSPRRSRARARRGRSWPMPSKMRRRESRIARAVARPASGRISGSLAPWMTVAGRRSLAQGRGAVAGGGDRVQLAGDAGAAVGAVVGGGGHARGSAPRPSGSRASRSSGRSSPRARSPPRARRRGGRTVSRMPSRSAPRASGCRSSTSSRPASAPARGWRIAIVWAIIPPIEAPTRCADSISRWSISPVVSSAMSRSR